MLFHLGALVRLDEAGLLGKVDRISSVSGGSITAAALAKHWSALDFDPATGVSRKVLKTVGKDLHKVASHTIDVPAVLSGALLPGTTIGDRVARAYRRRFLGDMTLQDLPDNPRFVFNATSLQSGVLWRFQKPYMADYRVGMVDRPKTQLATAVAASSAFPPVLSPVTLKLDPKTVKDVHGTEIHEPPYTEQAVLADGGVYDNLGLQPLRGSARILCSDGGGSLADAPRPKRFWPLQLLRVLNVIDNQVRALRMNGLVTSFKAEGPPDGAFWSIRTEIDRYGLNDVLPCPPERTQILAATPTRLAKLDKTRQRRLVNWGYAISDAAIRAFAEVPGPKGTWPYPDEKV
jgi:NTE family protein